MPSNQTSRETFHSTDPKLLNDSLVATVVHLIYKNLIWNFVWTPRKYM